MKETGAVSLFASFIIVVCMRNRAGHRNKTVARKQSASTRRDDVTDSRGGYCHGKSRTCVID